MIKKILAAVSSFAVGAVALIANAGMMDGRGYGMMGSGGGGEFIVWITTVLVWVALILAIIALLRWLKKNP